MLGISKKNWQILKTSWQSGNLRIYKRKICAALSYIITFVFENISPNYSTCMWLKKKQRPLAPDQNQQNLILQRLGLKKPVICH